MDWIRKIKTFFKTNDAVIGLIAVNVAVFVLYHVLRMFYSLFTDIRDFPLDHWLGAPADVDTLIGRPWTLITYMFFHQGILHILFNMLWLYWFGRIFRTYFSGWQLVNVYILGGLAGALFYVLSYNIFPVFAVEKHFAILLGASAGVLAVVMAISCHVPKYTVNLLFFGRIRLIYIALVTLVLDIISISTSDNSGGHIAHLGGAFFGYLFAVNFLKGRDITAWFGRFCAWTGSFFKSKPKLKVAYKRPPTDDREYNRQKNEDQQEIDRILDKISKGGYESLTRKEKEILFHQKG
ncbi:MAG: rhomboid family intramembrane serine protease [Bacteroidales bacterium]|jgi:membrane associated rhomboid family serine protease|nr:rhomboid family intramembrane serine protease [Bacteroidales bacterium]